MGLFVLIIGLFPTSTQFTNAFYTRSPAYTPRLKGPSNQHTEMVITSKVSKKTVAAFLCSSTITGFPTPCLINGSARPQVYQPQELQDPRAWVRRRLIGTHPSASCYSRFRSGFCLTLSWYVSNSWTLSVNCEINWEKAAEAACGGTEQKGSLMWPGKGTRTLSQKKGSPVTAKSPSVPGGICRQAAQVNCSVRKQKQRWEAEWSSTPHGPCSFQDKEHWLNKDGSASVRPPGTRRGRRKQTLLKNLEFYFPALSGPPKIFWIVDAATNVLVDRRQLLPLDLAGCSR